MTDWAVHQTPSDASYVVNACVFVLVKYRVCWQCKPKNKVEGLSLNT